MSPRLPSNRTLLIAAAAAGAVATAATAYYLIKRHRHASKRAPPPSTAASSAQSHPSTPLFSLFTPALYHTSQQRSPSAPCTPVFCRLPALSLHNETISHSLQTCNWLQQPQHDIPPACIRQFPWVVFWDLENVKIPSSLKPATFIHALRNALRATTPTQSPNQTPPIIRFLAVTNIHTTPLRLRTALQSNGISLLHVDSQTRKDACDKALITELCLLPREHSPPMGVALLSNDVDFAYPLARLAALGYHTVVVTPRIEMMSRTLATVPRSVLTFDNILTHTPSSNSPHNALQHSTEPLPTKSKSDQNQHGHIQQSRSPRNSRKHLRQQQNEKRTTQRAKQAHKQSSPKLSPASCNASSSVVSPSGKQKLSEKVHVQPKNPPSSRAINSGTETHRNDPTSQQRSSTKPPVQPQKRPAKSAATATSPSKPNAGKLKQRSSTKPPVQPQKRPAKSSAATSPSKSNAGKLTQQNAVASEQSAHNKAPTQPQKCCTTSSPASLPSKVNTGNMTHGNETASEQVTPRKHHVQLQSRSTKSSAGQSSSTESAGKLRQRNVACIQQNVSNNVGRLPEQQTVGIRTRRIQRLSRLYRTLVYFMIVLFLCILVIFRLVREPLWTQRWFQSVRMSW